jgi:hypothetical protein
MPLYFAYGSNMDEAAMAQRCPRSSAIGPAILHRHRIVIMAEGYASVVRDPRANVYGLLWDVALADVRALDVYESIATGLYSKAIQPVKRISDDAVRPSQQALVYFGRGEGGGKPLPGYLENVIACAERLAFPAAYITALERLSTGGGGGCKAGGKAPSRGVARAPVRANRNAAGEIIVRPRFTSPLDR